MAAGASGKILFVVPTEPLVWQVAALFNKLLRGQVRAEHLRSGMCALAGARRGGGTHVMYGCSRMTIDPRIPTMPARSTSGFHRPGVHC